MMYEHIVAKLRETYKDKDASFVDKHFAIQFNIWGEGHGALYMEIKNGHIYVEPYEYFDRDTLITTDADTLLGIASGKINPTTYGDLYVEGDFYALEILKTLSYTGPADDFDAEEDEEEDEESERKKGSDQHKKKVKERATDAAEVVREKATDAAEVVKERATDAAEVVKEKATDAAEEVKKKATGAAEVVKEKATDAAEAVKERATDAAEAVKEKATEAAGAVKGKVESIRRK
jgi:hypothetical protein